MSRQKQTSKQELIEQGVQDAIAGKPIHAFYDMKLRNAGRHTEVRRAYYEIGYRSVPLPDRVKPEEEEKE